MQNLFSQVSIAADDLLERYTWSNRLLLIFTPDHHHSEFVAQNEIIAKVSLELVDRDLVVLRMVPGYEVTVDGNSASGFSSADFYRAFSIEPGTFSVSLIGKDGTLKLTRSTAVAANTLFDLIDSMPMRQLEMQTKDAS